MTSQATNCLSLFKGANPSTIKQALQIQSPSIVAELKNHFGVSDLDTLSQRLSLGK